MKISIEQNALDMLASSFRYLWIIRSWTVQISNDYHQINTKKLLITNSTQNKGIFKTTVALTIFVSLSSILITGNYTNNYHAVRCERTPAGPLTRLLVTGKFYFIILIASYLFAFFVCKYYCFYLLCYLCSVFLMFV